MVCSVSTTITIKKTLFRPLEKSVPIPPRQPSLARFQLARHFNGVFDIWKANSLLFISMISYIALRLLKGVKWTYNWSQQWKFMRILCIENCCFFLSLDIAHKIQWIKSYGTWEYESFRCRFLRIKAYQLRNFRLKSYQPRIYWPLTYRLCAFISTKCMRNLWTQPQKPSVNRCQCK